MISYAMNFQHSDPRLGTSIDTTSVDIAPITSVQIFQESVEKDKGAFNVIVYSLPESSSTDIFSRVPDDKTKLSDIVLPLSINLPSNFKLIRLGKPSSENLRPLKIICKSKNEAVSIISDFGTAKKNDLLIPDNFKILRDKTTLERLLLRSCHAELELYLNLERLILVFLHEWCCKNNFPSVKKLPTATDYNQVEFSPET